MKRPGLALSSLFFLACGDAALDVDSVPTEAQQVVAAARAKRAACKNASQLNIVDGDMVMLPPCDSGTSGLPLSITGRHVMFLNFDGVDVRAGDTSIENQGLRNTMANLPAVIEMAAYAPDAMQRDTTILKIWRKVADFYADFNVDVVISRPLSSDYTMTVVGDVKEAIGLSGGTVGISPVDCKNLSDTNLNYAFSASLSNNPDQTAVTIAHECGHAYGLGHTDNMTDIMYPSVSPAEGFKSGRLNSSDPVCGLNPGAIQDNHQILEDNLGARPPALDPVGKSSPPVVSITSPKEGATLGRDLTIAIAASSQARGGIDRVTVGLSLADGAKFRGAHPVAELHPPESATQVRLSSPGNYELTATAYDQFGNVAIARSHFNVATITCLVPNDCAAGQKCVSNTCTTTTLPEPTPAGNPDEQLRAPGTACTQSGECRDGFCGVTPVGQICTSYCSGGRLCDPALECVDGICEPPMWSRTVPKLGQLGGKCSRKEDCFSGECSPFVDAATPRYCTRSCDPDVAWSCPSTMACQMGDTAGGMRTICQALPVGQMGEAGGCAASGRGFGRGTSAAALVTLLSLAFCLVFLRRRQSMYP